MTSAQEDRRIGHSDNAEGRDGSNGMSGTLEKLFHLATDERKRRKKGDRRMPG